MYKYGKLLGIIGMGLFLVLYLSCIKITPVGENTQFDPVLIMYGVVSPEFDTCYLGLQLSQTAMIGNNLKQDLSTAIVHFETTDRKLRLKSVDSIGGNFFVPTHELNLQGGNTVKATVEWGGHSLSAVTLVPQTLVQFEIDSTVLSEGQISNGYGYTATYYYKTLPVPSQQRIYCSTNTQNKYRLYSRSFVDIPPNKVLPQYFLHGYGLKLNAEDTAFFWIPKVDVYFALVSGNIDFNEAIISGTGRIPNWALYSGNFDSRTTLRQSSYSNVQGGGGIFSGVRASRKLVYTPSMYDEE